MSAPLRLAALVAPVLLIGLAACGSPDPEPTPAPAVAAPLPAIADVVEQVNPWVVSITTESLVRGIFTTFTAQQAGSGVIVLSDGYIATNNHVVNRARQVKVHLANGETYDARVVGQDPPPGDIAILKIDAEGAEYAILQGGRAVLGAHHPPILLSVHPRHLTELGVSIEQLRALIETLGYRIFDVDGVTEPEALRTSEYLLLRDNPQASSPPMRSISRDGADTA